MGKVLEALHEVGDARRLLTAREELDLSRQLHELETALWKRLLKGPLATQTKQFFLALDPPVRLRSAKQARAADPDREIAARVLATAHDPDLDAIVAAADRIREQFVTCNLRLVPSTVRRFGYHLTGGLDMSDLIQEGNLGLLRAVPRFDHRRGLRFSTFATWWIRHYIVRARQNLSTEVRVPVHLQELGLKVRRVKVCLQKELGRDPSQDEIAKVLKVSKKTLGTLEGSWLKYREAMPSFDSVGEEGQPAAHFASDAPLPDEVLRNRQYHKQIMAAVKRMPPQLAQIVCRHFGLAGTEPETFLQIGDSMQLSRERIRQLELKALAMLRQEIRP